MRIQHYFLVLFIANGMFFVPQSFAMEIKSKICKICIFSFTQEEFTAHRQFISCSCGALLPCCNSYNRHRELYHTNEEFQPRDGAKVNLAQPNKCPYCGTKSPLCFLFRYHLTHIKCVGCPLDFYCSISYKEHMRNSHSDQPLKYGCFGCPKVMLTTATLGAHKHKDHLNGQNSNLNAHTIQPESIPVAQSSTPYNPRKRKSRLIAPHDPDNCIEKKHCAPPQHVDSPDYGENFLTYWIDRLTELHNPHQDNAVEQQIQIPSSDQYNFEEEKEEEKEVKVISNVVSFISHDGRDLSVYLRKPNHYPQRTITPAFSNIIRPVPYPAHKSIKNP